MMPTGHTDSIDRLAIRSRPPGPPLMHQAWEDPLFLHWPIDPALLRPLIPPRLSIDTFEGRAWIGVTPFFLSGLRAVSLPPLPGFSSFYELNVRTYVHYEGVAGLWFLSLYASKLLPVLGARLVFSLPYREAEMGARHSAQRFHYYLRRQHDRPADFEAHWEVGEALPDPPVDSLEFFLVERYCLYTAERGKLWRCRVYHVPWLLRSAELLFCRSNLIGLEGLPEPAAAPLAWSGGDQEVEVWPLEEV